MADNFAKCLNCIHWKPCYNDKEWDAAIGVTCDHFLPAAEVSVANNATTTSLFFSHRRRLAEIFEKWAAEHGTTTTPLSVITYLHIEGLLDTQKAQELIKQKEDQG